MIHKKVNIMTGKFAIIDSNRNITNNKELKNSIEVANKVYSPLIVIRANEVDSNILLFDAITKKQIPLNSLPNYYLIIDGQHRRNYAFSIACNEQAKIEKNDNYNSKFSFEIPICIYSKEELGDLTLNEVIVTLNSSTKCWKNTDYIRNATKINGEDKLVIAVNNFSNLKFSLSSISRWICFNKDYLNTKTLIDYAENNTPIKYADYDRAIRLYKFLLGKGFSNDFLRKRYLIDYIIDEKQQHNGIEFVLNKINYLKRADEINQLKDCDISATIQEIINEDYENELNDAFDEKEINEIKELRDYLSLVDKEDVELFLSEPIAEKKETKKVKKETIKVEKVKKETKSNMPVVNPADNKAAIVTVEDTVDDVEETIEDAVEDTVEDTVEVVEDTVEDTVEVVEEVVEDAVEDTVDAVEDSINKDIVDEVNDAIANDNFIDAEYSVVSA